jgi:hypothetical protein
MRKYGTIGPFWPTGMNKEGMWNEIKAQEKKFSEGLQQPGAEEHAAELHEPIGGYFSLNRVRRSVGFFGVPAGWVPKLDDDLVVDDHDEKADAKPAAPARCEPPQQDAVKPLRKAVETPKIIRVSTCRRTGIRVRVTPPAPTLTRRRPPHSRTASAMASSENRRSSRLLSCDETIGAAQLVYALGDRDAPTFSLDAGSGPGDKGAQEGG